MSVIVELSLPPDRFELGRILSVEGATSITLETMVPLGDRCVPFFRLSESVPDSFESSVREHPAVTGLETVESQDSERLYALDAGIPFDIERVYNPTTPETAPNYGLTTPQRETLLRAVEAGYYEIPRQFSTDELAAEFDISDQAVTERLRRAITTLVENTLRAEREV